MTEPLGRSQVLEYLIDLSKENKIYLISFEREQDLGNVDEIKAFIKDFDIEWQYMVYSNKYGVASTVGQIVQSIRLGSKLIKEHSIDIVHARSMIPATMGLLLKKIHGVKLLFDIRGFAIDEKVDSRRLNKSSLLYKVLKKLDNHLYKASDHIVTLTHVAKEILHEKLDIPYEKTTVIPTCASKEVFKRLTSAEIEIFKSSLGYKKEDTIIIHTGTVSGWYDFESEVKLIKEMMKKEQDIHFLVLNKNEQPFIEKIVTEQALPTPKVKITSSTFDEAHKYLNIADASIFFIKPSYSKQASAPTKFAENVACKLPSVTNSEVGDMAYYMQQYNVGYVVDLKILDEELNMIAKAILEKLSNSDFRQSDFSTLFNEHFDKDMAVKKYNAIYADLTGVK